MAKQPSGLAGYFSFHGFARRQQFWAVFFIATIAMVVAQSVMYSIGADEVGMLVLSLTGAWLWVATATRRARDAGISPWWAALMVLPFVSLVMLIVLGSMRSVDQ